jgi:hypothetical protein
LSGDNLAKSSQTIWLATGTLCLAVCAGVFTCVIAGDLDFFPAKADQFQVEAKGIEADILSPANGIVSDALATGQEVVEEAVTVEPGSIVANVDNASLLKLLYGNYDAAHAELCVVCVFGILMMALYRAWAVVMQES